MTSREEFEKETGIDISSIIESANSQFPHEFSRHKELLQYALWQEKRNEWVSVEERLPERKTEENRNDNSINVLFVARGYPEPIKGHYNYDTDCFWDSSQYGPASQIAKDDVICWRYLPTLPDEAKRGRG